MGLVTVTTCATHQCRLRKCLWLMIDVNGLRDRLMVRKNLTCRAYGRPALKPRPVETRILRTFRNVNLSEINSFSCPRKYCKCAIVPDDICHDLPKCAFPQTLPRKGVPSAVASGMARPPLGSWRAGPEDVAYVSHANERLLGRRGMIGTGDQEADIAVRSFGDRPPRSSSPHETMDARSSCRTDVVQSASRRSTRSVSEA